MDGRVLDVPWPLRRFTVSAFILPKRPRESARAYKSIWWEEGSPLVVISERVTRAVDERLDVPVELGMRYGSPSIADALRGVVERAGEALEEIYFVPLYPHYAMSTVETAVELARKVLRRIAPDVTLAVHPPFFDHPEYIDALVASSRSYLQDDYDHLLFSYHGLPERHIRKSDPTGRHCLRDASCCVTPSIAHETCYRAQVIRTTEAFVKKAGVPREKYSFSFQSRIGRDPWLPPFTDMEFARLPASGVRRLRVICPSFVSDCLETLEEIEIRGREAFLGAGGEEFQMIPCLNENLMWLDTLTGWCRTGTETRRGRER